MANINIGGRLHSTATGNVVAGANEILDDNKGKKQSVINQEVDVALAGKQETLVGTGAGQNIKTIGGTSILGTGDIPIQAGDTNAVKYVAQTLTEQEKTQARTNIGAGTSDFSGDPIVSLSVTTPADGTLTATLASGNTITIDLNHNHPQYPKYVYCLSQEAYEAITTKESDTLYLILE